MKNRLFRTLLCVLLVGCLAVSLCACGEEPAPSLITDHCYITQESNGKTYSCTVTDMHGNTMFHRTDLVAPPEAMAIDDNVLCVYLRFGDEVKGSWAVYCDVNNGGTSKVFANVLGIKGMTIAYTDYLTDAHHVFIRDAVDEAVHFEAHTLIDADQGDPVLRGAVNEEGDLVVTYLSGSAEKTIELAMP